MIPFSMTSDLDFKAAVFLHVKYVKNDAR